MRTMGNTVKVLLPIVAAGVMAPANGAAQQPLVAPAGYGNVEGNTNNFWPWNLWPPAPSIRVQQIYDDTHFTSQGVTGPIRITRLRYRAEGGVGSWAGGTWPGVQIDMSTATVDFRSASLTFAQNHGPDQTTVVSGSVAVQGGSTATPGPWYVDIPLATPFDYDPAIGNDLVVDIRINAPLIGSSWAVDHVSAGGSPPPLGTRLLNSTGSSATVAVNRDLDYCAVTEFTFTALAGYRTFAAGCAGSAGVPSNQAPALPVLGQVMTVAIGNLPAPAAAIFVLGFSNTTSAFGPLPFDLTLLGAPGCRVRVSADASALILGPGSTAGLSLGIPGRTNYVGLQFYTQALALDAAANALGATTSDAAAGVIGY